MLDFDLDTASSILTVRPQSALAKEDFVKLATAVDPHIEQHGDLAGLIVDARGFRGWESLAAMIGHFRFVRDHHKHIKKVAAVTDSKLGDVAERLGSHFVSAEVKHFPAAELDTAKTWIVGG
jgi:hypothetical protein